MSGDHFGHKDYNAARAEGGTDEEITKFLDKNPHLLRGKNRTGGGGLYDQIQSGTVKGFDYKQGSSDGQETNNINNISNSGNTSQQGGNQDSQNKIRTPVTTTVDTEVDSNGGTIRGNSISGNNNNVVYDSSSTVKTTNNIDNTNNSININEGSSNFTYNSSGGNSFNETPVSAMTMAQGMKPTDTAASNAKFLATWGGLNRNLQNQSQGGMFSMTPAMQAIQGNKSTASVPDKSVINSSPLYMRDNSKVKMQELFGDPFQYAMPKTPDFNLTTIRNDQYEFLEGLRKNDDDDDD